MGISADQPERTLILLRHAKSDWSGGEADEDRPLAKRGQHQAPDAGRWLAASIDRIDLAVVSPANRARSTWQLVAAELDAPPPTRVEDRACGAIRLDFGKHVHRLEDVLEAQAGVADPPLVELDPQTLAIARRVELGLYPERMAVVLP